MTKTLCAFCHAPLATGLQLCPTCVNQLRTWLTELVDHAIDLETVVIPSLTSPRGEKVMVTGHTEPRQQWDADAAAARDDLRLDLHAIVMDLLEQGVRETLANNCASMAAFAARHVDTIAAGPAALETFDIVRHRHAETVKVVDTPAPRILLGPCDATVDGKVCGWDVRAAEGEPAVICRGCLTAHDVAAFKAQVVQKMRTSHATMAELVRHFQGIVRPNLLAVWRNRGRLQVCGDEHGEPLYSIGAVMDMIETTKGRMVA